MSGADKWYGTVPPGVAAVGTYNIPWIHSCSITVLHFTTRSHNILMIAHAAPAAALIDCRASHQTTGGPIWCAASTRAYATVRSRWMWTQNLCQSWQGLLLSTSRMVQPSLKRCLRAAARLPACPLKGQQLFQPVVAARSVGDQRSVPLSSRPLSDPGPEPQAQARQNVSSRLHVSCKLCS